MAKLKQPKAPVYKFKALKGKRLKAKMPKLPKMTVRRMK